MKVMFISQCTGNAILETRRILDSFALRKGTNTWETEITKQGLDTIESALRASARKNSAIACHNLSRRGTSKLSWVIGNKNAFNSEGVVPTNRTSKDLLKLDDENSWESFQAAKFVTQIAALFHDFGKATKLFQSRLKSQDSRKDRYRHEWISAWLFKEFVGEKSDAEWIDELCKISKNSWENKFENFEDQLASNKLFQGFHEKNRAAKFIVWLILSHHRIPYDRRDEEQRATDPSKEIENCENWLEECLSSEWNDVKEANTENLKIELKSLPFNSSKWCEAAKSISEEAKKYIGKLEKDWFEDSFHMHLCRFCLNVADHSFSRMDYAEKNLQDEGYNVYANTTKDKKLNQKLDEHLVGVCKEVKQFFDELRDKSLKALKPNFKPSLDKKFEWQDKSLNEAKKWKKQAQKQGFFGVCMASTGKGKTLGNFKIMSGLSDQDKGMRLAIATGLKTLTLQTSESLRNNLNLGKSEISVLIGSQEYLDLFERSKEAASEEVFKSEQKKTFFGVNTEGEFISDQDGDVDCNLVDKDKYPGIKKYFQTKQDKGLKLLLPPVLVCTIDYLIKISEGLQGGRQILPFMRLYTSDLILDEIDDFDPQDLPAIARLIYFAGLLGSKVLISSATITPSIATTFYEAYAEGRKKYNSQFLVGEKDLGVVAAWFDEYRQQILVVQKKSDFEDQHKRFAEDRKKSLKKEIEVCSLRKAKLVSLEKESDLAEKIILSLKTLHDSHFEEIHDKKISVGLIRFANINPMIKVLKEINNFKFGEMFQDYCIYIRPYHSRYPLIVRSKIEQELDCLLNQKNEEFHKKDKILSLVAGSKKKNHIFIVLATSVAEVGRDHDYDWAIVEPSSMRSIIQLAGRVRRHRTNKVPYIENIHILSKNINALAEKDIPYSKPGFETDGCELDEKDLMNNLNEEQLPNISSIPRLLKEDISANKNFSSLEHESLDLRLKKNTSEFWEKNLYWSGEMQMRTPFRKNNKTKEYYFDTNLEIRDFEADIEVTDYLFDKKEFEISEIFKKWIEVDLIEELLEKGLYEEEKCKMYTRFSINNDRPWNYHLDQFLGFYQDN